MQKDYDFKPQTKGGIQILINEDVIEKLLNGTNNSVFFKLFNARHIMDILQIKEHRVESILCKPSIDAASVDELQKVHEVH